MKNSVVLDKKGLLVRAAWASTNRALGRLPAVRYAREEGGWRLPGTPFCAYNVYKAFKELEVKAKWDDGSKSLYRQALNEIKQSKEVRKAAVLAPLPFKPKWTPWEHQVKAWHFARDRRAVMLAMDMGTGKTKVAIDLISDSMRDGKRKLVLVVGPYSAVVDVWPDQLVQHLAAPVDAKVNVYSRDVASSQRVKELKEAIARPKETLFAFLNYELVWRSPLFDFLRSVEWDWLVLDESHRAKAPGGKVSNAMMRIAAIAKRTLLLSGTPMNKPGDLYGQFRIMDPGILGTNHAKFLERYAIMGGFENRQILKWHNLSDLRKKFRRVAFHVPASVLNLPEEVNMFRTTELEPDAKRIYINLETDFIADIGDKVVTAANALAKMAKLQQLTSGYIKADDGTIERVGTEKAQLLADVLRDLPRHEPLVIMARFREDIDNIHRVCRESKLTTSEYSGVRKELKEWQSGHTDVLVVQIQSGSEAIDLKRSRYMIYYSITPSLKDYQQSRRRIARGGQTRSTTFIHLAVRGTIDTKIFRALRDGEEVVNSVLKDYETSRMLSVPTVTQSQMKRRSGGPPRP